MTDRTLPAWLRLALLFTGLLQALLGITLLLYPAAVNGLWPWPLTPITARLLGASSLVSMPLSFLSAVGNRLSAARIPMVMLTSYRVLQVLAGVIHVDRFDFRRPITWNYFGGGLALLVLLSAALALSAVLGRPAAQEPAWLGGDRPLAIGAPVRLILTAVAALYFVWGLIFLALGNRAAALWFEPAGVATSLTLRLFASPIMGLALGLWLMTRARQWRQVAIPAAAMSLIGLTGTFAIGIEWASVRPPTPLGYITAFTPLILLLIGLYMLLATRGRAPSQ